MRDIIKRVVKLEKMVGVSAQQDHTLIIDVIGIDDSDPTAHTAELKAQHPNDKVEYVGTRPAPCGVANHWQITIDLLAQVAR